MVEQAKLVHVIRLKLVDAILPSAGDVLALIVHGGHPRKIVWTAGRVLKEAALWKRVEELDYEERKLVLKRVTGFLEDFAARGVLQRRSEPQSIGYGNEIGFDYISPRIKPDSDGLKRVYDEVLAKGPFPSKECAQVQITGRVHGELVLYLADIAGLASRGERGLAALSESDRAKFRKLASSDISTRLPDVATRINPQATPELHALIAGAEQARALILKALESQLV
jgi:hypothetical protein